MSYGAFWMSWWFTATMDQAGMFFSENEYHSGQALLMFQWGCFTLGIFGITLHRSFNNRVRAVFATLALTYFMMALGQFAYPIKVMAGYMGFISGMTANFAAFTELTREVRRRCSMRHLRTWSGPPRAKLRVVRRVPPPTCAAPCRPPQVWGDQERPQWWHKTRAAHETIISRLPISKLVSFLEHKIPASELEPVMAAPAPTATAASVAVSASGVTATEGLHPAPLAAPPAPAAPKADPLEDGLSAEDSRDLLGADAVQSDGSTGAKPAANKKTRRAGNGPNYASPDLEAGEGDKEDGEGAAPAAAKKASCAALCRRSAIRDPLLWR